jgi:hypothetical protein
MPTPADAEAGLSAPVVDIAAHDERHARIADRRPVEVQALQVDAEFGASHREPVETDRRVPGIAVLAVE